MIYLISASDFTNRAVLSDYVNSQKLNIAIYNAQESFVRPLLGDTLYDDIVAKYDAGTLNAAETALYNKIVPYQVHRAYINLVSVTSIQATQSGLRKNIDDWSEQLAPQEMSALIKQHEQMAQVAYNDLYRHLEANSTTFTTWDNCNDIDTVLDFSEIGANNRQRGKYNGGNMPRDNRHGSRRLKNSDYYDRKNRKFYY